MAKIILYEQGTSGVTEYGGFIQQAYNKTLRWPSVQPLYARLRRSDPEVSAVRQIFTSLIRGAAIRWDGPDDPTPGDEAALEFANTLGEDLMGGWDDFLETVVSHIPFMGWGWFEVIPGIRKAGWVPPDDDGWRSEYDDGKIGLHKLAFRDSSSFYAWQFDESGRRMTGMVQNDFPHPSVILPLEDSLHLTFGDPNNPEGLSPLEAVWRLERIKYGLEVIQGIGFEHAAGYLDVQVDNTPTAADKTAIDKAARAILSAQEGNYATWPKGVTGEVKDIPFSAAPSILEAIRYFGIQKLTVFIAQWMSMAATSGVGSFAAMSDSSSIFMLAFNAMLDGFAKQFDDQVGKRLFTWNTFPGMTKRPRFAITPVNKVTLAELASILPALKNAITLGVEDESAIRKASGFLPEHPAEDDGVETLPVEPEPVSSGAPSTPDEQAQVVAQAARLLLSEVRHV
jgi:hypothetical protein